MVVETANGEATILFDVAAKRWYLETADQAA